MKIKCIYDSGEKDNDRYTIVLNQSRVDVHNRRSWSCFGCNSNPTHPSYGIGQHGEAYLGRHLGKKIAYSDLPGAVQKCLENLEYTI